MHPVIEEIDNGLHASRTGELISALIETASAGDFDVLCTTHNPVLIDNLPAELLNSIYSKATIKYYCLRYKR